MTKWEYKMVRRSRGWQEDTQDKSKKSNYWMVASDWSVDMEKTLLTLGDEGWELVAITPRSGYLGAQKQADIAGFTSEEIWVFKRLKP